MSIWTGGSARRLCGRIFQKNVQEGFASGGDLMRGGICSSLQIGRPQIFKLISSKQDRSVGECQHAYCKVAQQSNDKPGLFQEKENVLAIDSFIRGGAIPSGHRRIDSTGISEIGGNVLDTAQGKFSTSDSRISKGVLVVEAGRLRRSGEPYNFGGWFQDLQYYCRIDQRSLLCPGKPLGRHGRNVCRAFSTTFSPPDWDSGPPVRVGTDASAVTELALDSVVKIFTMASSPNYFLPWQNKPQRETTGSGFVISGQRIVTNAHVVADQTYVSVRKHGSPSKYRAEVQAVGHECDLALLQVHDKEFWEGMRTLQLGDIPFLQESVAVVGYPQGGDNISVTGGVVSRVEPTQYVHGTAHLMAIQIAAAINPGNSGGPALMEDKVVGVAFQKLAGAENIGYIIPVPIINHFLEDVEENEQYIGFCSLGITCQSTENPQLREHLKMLPGLTGVLVNKIQPLTNTNQWLKKDDVLLAFDGVPIANDGTVHFRNRERISFDHLVSMKKAGELARLTVLRDGITTNFSVKLHPVRFLVPLHQFDRLPSYFIFAGLVFTPLTQPYLHEYGEDWYNSAPRQLCERAMTGILTKPREQLVILSQVLMDDVNAGYERLADYQVRKVNGIEVLNLRHLKELVESCTLSSLRFDLDEGRVVVLNFERAREASHKILLRHRIPSHTSVDLLQETLHSVDNGSVPETVASQQKEEVPVPL